MQAIHLGPIDYAIMVAYVAFVVGIGLVLGRYMKSSADFLTSARSIPTWVTGLAFISANLGALELVGMAASGAKYGISTAHFYWVGAIPAMIFLAVFMMPFYYGSKARSVPEYLNMRFDGRVRALNAVAFAVMTIFASGISMNALAKLLNQLLGWDYNLALWVCSGVVLIYVLKGGLTSAIYTEVLQFFMIVLGFAPVVYLGLKDTGGWHAMNTCLQQVAVHPATLALNDKTFATNAWSSAWQPLLGGSSTNPMGVDLFAMVFGLGFVLSFGYWCTNFLVVQRAMAAKNMTAARNTPLVASVPKMFFPFLVIVPGMIAVALTSVPDRNYRIPPPILSDDTYAKGVEAVKRASEIYVKGAEAVRAAVTANADADVKAVNDALSAEHHPVKVNPATVMALVVDYAVDKISDQQIQQRLDACVTEGAPPSTLSSEVYAKGVDAVKTSGEIYAQIVGNAMSAKDHAIKLFPAKINMLVAENAGRKLSDGDIKQGLYGSIAENDYDGVILSLVKRYCPPGLLGLALTALLASFMSGMAGNVTAFNTVFTYDLYQSFRRQFVDVPYPAVMAFGNGKREDVVITPKEPSDSHYMWMGKFITVVGILLSILAAYFASMYNNAMDIIQLVFGFVNAPLFATFLLGMFWKRTTATGAFFGLFAGIGASAVFHALTTVTTNVDAAHHVINGMKGGYAAVLHAFPSEMAQNFNLAAFAFIACFIFTLVISLATKRTKTDADLKGLVYSLTPKIQSGNLPWFQQPGVLGVILLVCCVILNVIFW